MRPDYCPIANEPCQSMCETPCSRRKMMHKKDQDRAYTAAKIAPTTGMTAVSSAAYIELYERAHGITKKEQQ
jgi:hypothetical protein